MAPTVPDHRPGDRGARGPCRPRAGPGTDITSGIPDGPDTMVREHRELERTYDVGAGCVVPDLRGLPRIAALAASSDLDQVATYYDTSMLSLLSAGVTLRRRTGGEDDCWHLKVPTSGEARVEIQALLTDPDAGPPRALVDQVRVIVRDRVLAPVAELRTHRQVHRLVDERGNVAAELCDDRVIAETWVGRARVEEWREWELELGTAPDGFLDLADPVLLHAGARRAGRQSKLARALAEDLPTARAWRSHANLAEEPTAGDLLVTYLVQRLLRLEEQDALLRVGNPEAVHQLRVACRRMRSALATYSPVLKAGVTVALREELRWLGAELGQARDAQVLRERFGATLEVEPTERESTPVPAPVVDELGQRFQEGRDHAHRALSSDRYFRLLGDLEDFLDDPPFRKQGRLPARPVARRLLRRDLDRLRKRHRHYERATSPRARDLALHDVRKAAKRLRYAAETAQPVFGERALRVAERAEAVQELLGDHQDSVVGQAVLRELSERDDHSGRDSRTIARLHAQEEARASQLVRAYPETVGHLNGREMRGWP